MALEGYNLTHDVCDEKWRNLKKQYKKYRDNMEGSGNAAIKWEYFCQMNDILGHRPDVLPVSEMESSAGELVLPGK